MSPRVGVTTDEVVRCVPEDEIVRWFEISRVHDAEHSFNASTVSARVVASVATRT